MTSEPTTLRPQTGSVPHASSQSARRSGRGASRRAALPALRGLRRVELPADRALPLMPFGRSGLDCRAAASAKSTAGQSFTGR